ncbi:MAG: flagellar basal body rod protein FlgB [Caldimicrobium sp.]|nr:flagellar basal body rod protein FlgB [Caldimicrobium sp.]MCX7873749.1 flagellar basal body rod protein FlgB [Caldimicrobium sp.]MDW8093673.1 flagellar basal body rod protein FlgB [Caldimicrobium sp.]
MWGSLAKLMDIVRVSLKIRTEKHKIISANIANVDTPGYRRKDLSFERAIQTYLSQERALRTTKDRHFPVRGRTIEEVFGIYQPQTLGTPNNVNLEEEMVSLTENQLLYESTLQALAKELERLREIISEGGR